MSICLISCPTGDKTEEGGELLPRSQSKLVGDSAGTSEPPPRRPGPIPTWSHPPELPELLGNILSCSPEQPPVTRGFRTLER